MEKKIKMGRKKSWFKGWDSEWTVPIFIVLAIVVIWLGLSYLPLSTWGIDFDTSLLWTFMPWILVFAIGLYGVKRLIWK